jgi:hypothetical protein
MRVALSLILGLAGCPFTVNQLNRLPATEPLAQPASFNRPGPLLHEPSGFEFPEWYAHFQRVTAYRYDSAGLHIGIGYNDRRPECLIVATFYVYPTPRMSFVGASPDVVSSIERGWLDQEFGRSKRDIEQHHPAMESVHETPVVTPAGGSALHGSSLTFREAASVSELRLFVYGHQWFLKYRFTYPEACEGESRQRLDAMIQELPWAAARHGAVADEPRERRYESESRACDRPAGQRD